MPELATLYGVTLEELCGDDIPRPDRNAFVSRSLEDEQKALQLIEDQLFILNRAWPLLATVERDALVTMATSLAEARRKSA